MATKKKPAAPVEGEGVLLISTACPVCGNQTSETICPVDGNAMPRAATDE